MILPQVKRLAGFASTRAVLPALTMVHVTEKGAAFAGDGEVELYIPQTFLPADARWSVPADVLLKVTTAAGANATAQLNVDAGQLLIGAGKFAAQVGLAERNNHVTPGYAQMMREPKNCMTWKIADAEAFTAALYVVSRFAATDAAAGAHWMAVLLRNGRFYASDRGFGAVCASVDGAPVFDKDVLIPARACAAITDAHVKSLTVNEAAGLGAFELSNGQHIVFRLVIAPSTGYPDADRLLVAASDPGCWAVFNADVGVAIAQAAAVLKTDLPVISLRKDEELGNWYIYADGYGQASVDLPDFKCANGVSLDLPQTNWNLLVQYAAEVAPLGDTLQFRGELCAGKSRVDLFGCMAAYIQAEEE